AAGNAPDTDNTDIAAVIQRRDLHLEGTVQINHRRLDLVDDHLEQGSHVFFELIQAQPGNSVQCRGIHHREIELLFCCTQTVEQVKHLINNPLGTCTGTVDLVDHHNRVEALLEGLLGDEAGLRHGSAYGVHDQQHGIHHRQNPLYLTAEVGVSGGVHDVDAVSVPLHRRAFGG